MRSSTVLVLNLNSLAHETIKNIVLSGIGHLIVIPSPSLRIYSMHTC
jgi:ubiquitin-like 1-activating enzyme E1 A